MNKKWKIKAAALSMAALTAVSMATPYVPLLSTATTEVACAAAGSYVDPADELGLDVEAIPNTNSYRIVGLKTTVTSIEIPSTYLGNYPITEIAATAFEGCNVLSYVGIPSTITSIGAYAFNGCTNLTKLTVPDTVTYIADNAFPTGLTVYCNSGSYAQQYCISHKVPYVVYTSVANLDISYAQAVTYTGSALTPTVTVKNGTTTLKEGTDYTITYSNNIQTGTASFTIKGLNQYTGSVTKTFNIVGKDISQYASTISYTETAYTGAERKPTVTITNGTTALKEGTEYTVTYTNNIEPGTAMVTLTGIGEYSGTIVKTFKITTNRIDKMTMALEYTSAAFTGSEMKPAVTVTDPFGTVLKEGIDYILTYTDNKNVGKATATITGYGNYLGTQSKTFDISQYSIENCSASLAYDTVTYDGKYKEPALTLVQGSYTLVKDTDYWVVYTDNLNVGTAKVSVIGIGNYSGQISKTFTITQAEQKPAEKTVQVGDYEDINGARYQITSESTAMYIKALSKTQTSYTVPGYITVDGTKYYVTAIDDRALANCKQAKTITIGRYVEEIGARAFWGTVSLQKLTFKTAKLRNPKLDTDGMFKYAGKNNYAKLVVSVPAARVTLYTKLFQARDLSKKATVK